MSPDFRDVRVVAFDLDNTLVDVIRVKERAACEAARVLVAARAARDVDRAARELLATAFDVGIDREDVVERHLARRGVADERVVAAARAAWERGEDAGVAAYRGARRGLADLAARGYRLALVTDAPRRYAERRLRIARLDGLFERVLALEDSPRGKADAAPFARLTREMGVEPCEVLMVGDNPERDVGSARAHGCRTAHAAYGMQAAWAHMLARHAPDASLSRFRDLLGLLTKPSVERALATGRAWGREAGRLVDDVAEAGGVA